MDTNGEFKASWGTTLYLATMVATGDHPKPIFSVGEEGLEYLWIAHLKWHQISKSDGINRLFCWYEMGYVLVI